MTTFIAPPSTSVGHWLPQDRSVLRSWLAKELKEFRAHKALRSEPKELDPSLQNLKKIVDSDRTLSKQSNDMFSQIPPGWCDDKDPTGQPNLKDFAEMLEFINDRVFGQGPQWYYRDSMANDLVGFPINAILDWPMGTEAGYCFFQNVVANEGWKGVLNAWGGFLSSPESQPCLDPETGWLSPKAREVITEKGKGTSFEQLFVCEPDEPYYGYKTWDEFFVRKFREGIRPLPEEQALEIVNSCESEPLDPPFVRPALKNDSYWVKGHPYSLVNMLNNDPLVDTFVGGTIYQAFLSALSYHCWHAPVNGKVVKAYNVDGTYYSEATYAGFPNPDPSGPNWSQQYISNVAARGIIFIESDNPEIGLIAIVYIGMSEVSSCEFTVKEGDTISKGDLIGTFHFGGSSHCILFRPGVDVKFVREPTEHGNNKVNSPLAVVIPKQTT